MQIKSSEQAYTFLKKRLPQDVEEFWCIALGPSLKLLSARMIFRGTVDSCFVHPRDIFRFACLINATQLIVAHNHPSGDLEPSPNDIELTQRLVHLGQIIEIPVIDHLILTHNNFISLAEYGFISNKSSIR